MRFELMTPGLQDQCSTTELQGLLTFVCTLVVCYIVIYFLMMSFKKSFQTKSYKKSLNALKLF
jgi:preprotein translocase subunit YajC